MQLTPQELLTQIINETGPCMRICAYCPEDLTTSEVKECVENLIRENYQLKQDYDKLMKAFVRCTIAYKNATGEYYKELEDEN